MGAKGPSAPAGTLNDLSGLAGAFGSAGKSLLGTASSALGSAKDFWSGILQGNGTGGQQLVAPSAQKIGQVYSGNAKTLQNFMPAGGERNLALEQNQLGKASSIAGLYQNVQPYAASQLASLGGTAGSTGTGAGGVGTSGFGALTGYQSNQNNAKAASMGGIGGGLGSILSNAFLGPAKSMPWIFA